MSDSSAFDPKVVLLSALAVVTLWFCYMIWRGVSKRASQGEKVAPTAPLLATGFITNFFDTLGIGSFATTTTIVRHWKLFSDELLPGTLNTGHTLATIAQAFIYTRIVPVEASTLILMIVAAVLGAWLGAGVVAKWPRRAIQIGMGTALMIFAFIQLLTLLHLLPSGGDLLGIHGARLAIGLTANFMLGALMTVGIGLYAPCMILVSLLGMSPTAAFPIMMGSCAFLMPVAGARFVQAGKYDARAVLGFIAGGIPAVLIAAFIVKSLPLDYVKWLVVIVVVYTAANMLRAALGAGAKQASEVTA
ncbi:MAG: sulfite exporter TauE/SafE family protein [Gemmatimonadaceae bacterium]